MLGRGHFALIIWACKGIWVIQHLQVQVLAQENDADPSWGQCVRLQLRTRADMQHILLMPKRLAFLPASSSPLHDGHPLQLTGNIGPFSNEDET